jgi:formate dehydrogenase subunit gamma
LARHSSWDLGRAREAVAPLAGMSGPLLPMLHRLQETFGYIDRAAVPLLADLLNLSRAEVHGVVTFYRDFRTEPPAPHTIEICRAEACQSMQGEALLEHLRARLGIGPGETTADGRIALREVFCLGHCACAPSATIDHEPHARLTPAALDRLLDVLETRQ